MNSYNPIRLWKIFHILLTLFLLIKKKSCFIFIKPLNPEKLRIYITQLGTSFIKLAQVLATRSDFFEPKYLNELKKIHDNLPPMNDKDFIKIDKPKFAKFNKIPIASASIGQVHEAWLEDGTKLAVKIRRYEIQKKIKADIKIISCFNQLFKPLFSHYTKNSIEAVINEFSTMILKETSMRQELFNLKKFSQIYKDSNIIFPKFYEELSNDDIFVMSFEEGFRFDDVQNIKNHNIDIKKAINDIVLFYVEQMLIKGFFHADPHPGNVLINKNSQIILLDYGMVKLVPNETRLAIIELLKSANEQDYVRYIHACKKLGISAYETPTGLLAEFVEQIFSIFSNDSLSKTNMQDLAFEVMKNTRKFPFKLPQEAIYILRVSAIIEGLGTSYIENFNGIKDILPILVKNIPRAVGAKESILETLYDEITDIMQNLYCVKNTFYKVSAGELEMELSKQQLGYFQKIIDEKINSLVFGFIFIFISFFILIYDKTGAPLSIAIFLIGVLKLIYRK